MKYYFKAFGLIIKSEFPFQGTKIPEKGFFDVDVSNGTVPDYLEKPEYVGISFESSKNQFLLKIPTVANFLISDGKRIIVNRFEGAELREVELFMMGSAFAVILMQRSIVPFHGSAFEKEGKAVIISGISGSGKSSLLRYFISQGYKALTDDVCALSEQDNRIILTPSYPSSKIWADVMEEFELAKESEKQVRPDIEKYKVDFEDSFVHQAIEVESIYILNSNNEDHFSVENITGFEKFKLLKKNLYRPKFPKAIGKEKETFVILNKLAQQISLHKIYRSKSIKRLMAFNEYAKKQIIA